MDRTVFGYFDNRRDAELALEHLVQERGIQRTSVSLRAAGEANTAGVEAAGADVESGHPGVAKHGSPKLAGEIELSVVCREAEPDVVSNTLKESGARRIRLQ